MINSLCAKSYQHLVNWDSIDRFDLDKPDSCGQKHECSLF